MSTKKKWVTWPSLQEEVGSNANWLDGVVLNLGSGHRKIELPNACKVINLDLYASGADITADAANIPLEEDSVDSIISVALLEHCREPWKVVEEMARVLKPNGKLYCVVPFFQPIHNYPDDFFRFTPSGINSLLFDRGFHILSTQCTHSIWHTTGWVIEDYLLHTSNINHWMLWPIRATFRAITCYKNISISKMTTTPNAITVLATRTNK